MAINENFSKLCLLYWCFRANLNSCLALQKKEVDAVKCANSQLKTKSEFCKLEQKPVELYPSIVYLKWNTLRSEIEPSTYIKPHKKEIVLIFSTADNNVA